MIQERGEVPVSTDYLGGTGVRTPPSWFRWLTDFAGLPVLLSLLVTALLIALPVHWSYNPPVLRRVLNFAVALLGSTLTSFFLAARYLSGGDGYWLLLGMGSLALGSASFLDATPLPGDPIDTGITVHGLSAALCGILSLLAVLLIGHVPLEHRTRRSAPALLIGYAGTLILVMLLTWAKLVGRIPAFFVEDVGSTIARQRVLSVAVVTLAAASTFLYLAARRRHPFALRWCAWGLALLAVGIWGQANVERLWGLLAWTSRAVLGLGSGYLLVGSILSNREPHAGTTVPLSALLQSERQFRAFFENAGVGTAQIGADLRFIRVNDRFCAITGYSREALLGMSPLDLNHPDEREADDIRVRRLFKEPGSRYDAEKRYVCRDGRIIWVHVTISLVRDPQGKPLHTAAIVEDITERVQEEHRASRYTTVVAGINCILSEAVNAQSVAEVGSACLSVGLDMTGSSVGFMGELETDGELREIAVVELGADVATVSEEPGDHIESRSFAADSLYRRVLDSRKSLMVNDLGGYPDSAETLAAPPNLSSFLGVPLIQGGVVVGLLAVGNREGGYTAEHQEDLEELAPAVAQALSKKRAEQVMYRHLTELETLDRTNRALLREINHRVKNNLSAILGLIYTEQRRLRSETTPSCHLVLNDLGERVRNLAAAHTLLSAGGWRPLQLRALVEEVIMTTLPATTEGPRLVVEVSASPVTITPVQAHHLSLVLGELAMNTAKYGCGPAGTGITVDIQLEADRVRMVYRDRGPGYPDAVLAGGARSVGMGLLDTIVTMSLRGTWSIWNEDGAVMEIWFPLQTESKGRDIYEP